MAAKLRIILEETADDGDVFDMEYKKDTEIFGDLWKIQHIIGISSPENRLVLEIKGTQERFGRMFKHPIRVCQEYGYKQGRARVMSG